MAGDGRGLFVHPFMKGASPCRHLSCRGLLYAGALLPDGGRIPYTPAGEHRSRCRRGAPFPAPLPHAARMPLPARLLGVRLSRLWRPNPLVMQRAAAKKQDPARIAAAAALTREALLAGIHYFRVRDHIEQVREEEWVGSGRREGVGRDDGESAAQPAARP